MNATRIVLLVARRELIERVRSPMFIGMLVIIVLIIGAVVLLPAVFTDNTRNVGLVDPPSSTMEQLITGEAERAGLTVAVTTYPDVPAAEAALAAGKADAVIVAGHEVVWEAEAHPQVETVVMSALFATAVEERAATLDLDATAAAGLLAPPELTVRSLETVDPDIEARRTMAMVAMVLLFMAIAMYGAFVLTGVVEEKSSRVVEVLLARVSPRHLLAGKILGIGALGLVQVVVIAVAAAVALRVSDWGDVELPPVSPALVLWLVVWFVLGFAFYSTAYGALGALASRSEDAQSATGPVTVLLVVSYFFVFIAVAGDGTDWVVRLATLLPLTAPMAVPMRAAAGELPAWEAVAAVALMCLAIYGMIRFAGRVYTGAVLRTGAKVKLRDAWQTRT